MFSTMGRDLFRGLKHRDKISKADREDPMALERRLQAVEARNAEIASQRRDGGPNTTVSREP